MGTGRALLLSGLLTILLTAHGISLDGSAVLWKDLGMGRRFVVWKWYLQKFTS